MTDLKQEFWTRMAKLRSAMLGLQEQGRLVAMTPYVDKDLPGGVWFVTAIGTEMGTSVTQEPRAARLVLCSDEAGLYADIDGTLTRHDSKDELDEVWNAAAAAWFDEGKDDPDVCLMKFTPTEGEVAVTSTSGMRFLYEIAKGNLTRRDPDMGDKGVVKF